MSEPLHIHAYFDASVLEVFVNSRTVISTRIYTPHGQACAGLKFFASATECQLEPSASAAVLLRADVWDGLGVIRDEFVLDSCLARYFGDETDLVNGLPRLQDIDNSFPLVVETI
jgi:hypothetical protein